MMKKLILVLMLVILSQTSFSADNIYQFKSDVEQQRFDTLTHELRCMVCQNQSLAESNAPLALDLRRQVYEQVSDGKSNREIIDYLVSRYGDYVLYKPPFKVNTLILWFAPFFLLTVGLLVVLLFVSRQKREKAC